jgi:Na+/melibiose symporter-like transporter
VTRLILVCVFTAVIHSIDALYYSSRISAVRVRKLGIALTLFNILLLFSRFANTIQAPLTGSLVDRAVLSLKTMSRVEVLSDLAGEFRWIILAATVGSIIGAILVPTFVEIFTKVLAIFEKQPSVLKLFLRLFRVKTYRVVADSLRSPIIKRPEKHEHSKIPKAFLIANVIVVSVYTVGILATMYSGALIPDQRSTANALSGLVNVIATFLLIAMVDPMVALITDQAIGGERSEHDVQVMVWYLVAGKVVGTLLGQLIFLPAAGVIASAAYVVAEPSKIFQLASYTQFFPRLF